MNTHLTHSAEAQALIRKASGVDQPGGGARLNHIVEQVLQDLFKTIEKFNITPTEFWSAASYMTRLGQENEAGLLVAGLGVERFLDMLVDEQERLAGLAGGTPRAIEGPLWVADAPLEKGYARLDQDADQGAVLFIEGSVRSVAGQPIPGAIVDAWHANSKGGYSFFDPSQSAYNLRRRVQTDAQGRFAFRSTLPVGYSCRPGGPTEALLQALNRHGHRPAHLHFFVQAPEYRKLTTQLNLAGDEYLHDDFAFGTREGLIVDAVRHDAPQELAARGVDAPFYTVDFDFLLNREADALPASVVERDHAQAG